MRVISGEFRGMKLASPKGEAIRPTTDRIKEDVFNILRPYIYSDSIFLDLFGGTGSIAIEAVSRGCEKAHIIDTSVEAVKLIKENVQKTKQPERFRVLRRAAFDFLIETPTVYDIIYMDPPYAFDKLEKLTDVVTTRGKLADGGVLVVETGLFSGIDPGEHYELFKEKKYSKTLMRYYRYPEALQ